MSVTVEDTTAPTVVFSTGSSILFSALTEKKMGLTMAWKKWTQRVLELQSNAVLHVKDASTLEIVNQYNLSKVTVTQMPNHIEDQTLAQKEVGILLQVKTIDGLETQIRFILSDQQQDYFYYELRKVAKEHNLDNLRTLSLTEQMKKGSGNKSSSVMRHAVATAMDQMDKRTRHEQIVSKRGVMKWLPAPAVFANDMVHGAWWYVVASIAFTISSAVILDNSFMKELGDDDSFLSRYRYRATWVLMIISGAFFSLGSLAFVRAVHSDPPMKPLFSWYHVQSDELLGAWLFFLAMVPLIPYALIYLAASNSDLVYLVFLGVVVVFVFVTYLFVRACYPNDGEKPRLQLIQGIAYYSCLCCCSQKWLNKHLPNDWLAGCWILLWTAIIATFISTILTLYEIYQKDTLLIFLMATTLFECVCCWIGSCYWVAGSYAENESETADEENQNNNNEVCKQSGSSSLLNSSLSNNTNSSQQKKSSEKKRGWFAGLWRSRNSERTKSDNFTTPFISADYGDF